MAHKNYVLDSSVIIHDPLCFGKFIDNTIIIPIAVLEELDGLKVKDGAVGFNARKAIKVLDKYCNTGNVCDGIEIENNIKLFIDITNTHNSKFNSGSKDDSILACLVATEGGILVSKDVNMRIRAKAFGFEAQDYENDKIKDVEHLYKGYREVCLDDNCPEELSKTGKLTNVAGTIFEDMYYNEFAIVSSNGTTSIYRKHSDESLQPLKIPGEIYGLKSRNKEQAMALDLLLDPSIPLVSLSGPAGTGKTLLIAAAALHQVLEIKKYNRVEFYKSISSVGENLGFLPGTIAEKINPHMGSVMGAIETLTNNDFQDFMHMYSKQVKLEAVSFLRGKSINNKVFVFVDEIQNFTKSEIKTIVSRIGYQSKIVLAGDLFQIDNNHYLDETNNALTHVIERFKTSKLSGNVMLTKGERSELATEAAKIL